MNLFIDWVQKESESRWVKRALTDNSYKCFLCNGLKNDQEQYCKNQNIETNKELATLGDAVIKMVLSDMLLDKADQLSEERKKYENDKFLVDTVARHYDLLKYMKFDENDNNMPHNYDYGLNENTNKNPHKYIATCVEAVIGAIYKENVGLQQIEKLLSEWMELYSEDEKENK